jgi:predicted permease
MVAGMSSEFRYALRGLRKSPGFTTIAILSLALGLGANMAMFGVVKSLLLTPLPVDDPQELSLVTWRRDGDFTIHQFGSTGYRDPETGVNYRSNLSYPIYRALGEAAPEGVDLFAFSFLRGVSVALPGQPAFLAGGAMADAPYFTALRVPMVLGRPIRPADDVLDAPVVAVLSHSFWMRAFGGDPEIVGKSVRVNGRLAEVIGVTAPGFKGMSKGGFFPQTEITVPLHSQPLVAENVGSGDNLFTSQEMFWLRVMARIREGVHKGPVEQALGRTLATYQSPLLAADGLLPTLRLLPGERGAQPILETRARLLYFLLGVVGIVLLIACVNLAGLTLARGVARQREVAVRRALGVGRLALIRQMLLEGLILSGAGAGLGLFMAVAGRGVLRDLLTGSVGGGAFGDVEMNLAMDPAVISVGVGLAVVATLGFSLLPALKLSRLQPSAWLKPRGAGDSNPRLTVGRVLIALQIAISVPLLVGAVLFLKTMGNLGSVELGFDPRDLAMFQVDPAFTEMESEEYGDLYLDLLAEMERLPGVSSATLIGHALMGGIISNGTAMVNGEEHRIHWNAVGPGFLETLGLELVAGRVPGRQDALDSPLVGAVNETAVREIFNGESPIGRSLQFQTGGQDIRIIGVVKDMPYQSQRDAVPPTLFPSALQRNTYSGHHVVLRTNMPPAQLEPAVREAVYRVDPNLPVPELMTQTGVMAKTSAKERVFSQLLSLFGAFALLLASIGLYGVTSYSVTRRTSEIGVRVAMGAQGTQILWLILRQVAVLAGIGLVVGVLFSLALGPLVGSLLFGVAPTDPLMIALAGLTMVGVALGAGLLPALRASSLDPVLALQSE